MSAPGEALVVVVGSDGSADSERAIEWAASAAAIHSGSTLHLLEALALPPTPMHSWAIAPETLVAEAERRASTRLAARAAAISNRAVEAVPHVRRFFPVEAIVELAQDLHADLIVLGRHGHASALRRALIGSVSGDVSRSAPSPVVVVRGDTVHSVPPRRVLVSLDGSDPSRAAARATSRLFPGVAALAVSVGQSHEGLAEDEIARQAAACGFDPARLEVRRVDGDPAELLLRLAADSGIDLISAGRRGHGPLRDLLVGGVAEKLLQLAPCPILLAH